MVYRIECGNLSGKIETRGEAVLQRRVQTRKRAKKRRISYNSKTLLWFLCLPIGFIRMWSDRCTWRLGAKYAVSGVILALLVAVLVVPSPQNVYKGSIELYGEDPEVEVYGPGIPQDFVVNIAPLAPQGESIIVPDEELVDDHYYVYATSNQKAYHTINCRYAYATAQKLTLYEAFYLGYVPCEYCNPKSYNGEMG